MKTTTKLLALPLWAAALSLPFGLHAQHVSFGFRIGLPAPVYVGGPPPAAYGEVVVSSPGPGYLWVPGHYSWRHDHWVWIRGAWVLPPQPGAYWVPPQYVGQQWVEGHWMVSETPPPPPPPAPQEVVEAQPPPGSEVVVDEPPPPPLETEVVVGAPPAPGYVWIGGYWGWAGGRRVWTRGHWALPPRHGAIWVAPRWDHRGGRYVFVRGYWR